MGVYDTSSNAYIEHAPVRNAILAFFKRLLSLEDDGMFLVYDVQISNFLCDVVQNAYPSKTPAEVTLAFENLALVFRCAGGGCAHDSAVRFPGTGPGLLLTTRHHFF